MNNTCPIPAASGETGLKVLKGLARERSLLAALEIMQEEVGPAFQITLPGFQPAVMVGPESNRQILVSEREHFNWRSESDPVSRLLRHGLLVEDGETHDRLRSMMEPLLQRGQVMDHVPAMVRYTDQVLNTWQEGSDIDMLVEMRRVALLIFMGTLLDLDFTPHMERLWEPILRSIRYISPGLWILWPDVPRPGYKEALEDLDRFLYKVISRRRMNPGSADDLLGSLIRKDGLSDDLIRDQILTMLIAGHDTSTALLAWALYLLVQHPAEMARAQKEVDDVLGQEPPTAENIRHLTLLDMVIKETLRLYPPIHVGNRIVNQDSVVAGYELAAGTRTMMSIYLSHRDKRYWSEPDQFRPQRFALKGEKPPPFTYIPFGGGPRNCIGAAFAQVEVKVVLARILQSFKLTDSGREVRPHMGATLEPSPGVFIQVKRRRVDQAERHPILVGDLHRGDRQGPPLKVDP